MTDPASPPVDVRRDYPSTRADYIQPTLGYALRVWWALYWRTTAIAVVLIGLTGVVLRAMYEHVLISAPVVIWGSRLSPYLFTYAAAIPVMRFVLHKRFNSFRIALWSLDGQMSAADEMPSWNRTIRVWWAYSWRTLIYSAVGGVVVGYPMGMMVGIVSPSPVVMRLFGLALGTVVGAGVELYVIYSSILDENIADLHVGLLALEAPQPNVSEAVPTSAV
jgi:hypothetical protein